MNRLWIRPLLAGTVLWAAGTSLCATPLPFTIDTQDGQWKSAAIQQIVAPGITCEMVVTHAGGTERLIILSSPGQADSADALSPFAHLVIDSLTSYRSANVKEKAATEFGFTGRELQLDLISDEDAYDCTLFVFFAEGQTRWAVVHARSKGAPAPEVAAFSLLHKATATPVGVTTMAPLRVKDSPLSAFPISFRVNQNTASDHVLSIVVTEVPDGSSAERDGVKIGDAILAINGRDTQDFIVGVGRESELGRIFLNRDPGDVVKLTLLHIDSNKSYSITLRVPDPHHTWRGFP